MDALSKEWSEIRDAEAERELASVGEGVPSKIGVDQSKCSLSLSKADISDCNIAPRVTSNCLTTGVLAGTGEISADSVVPSDSLSDPCREERWANTLSTYQSGQSTSCQNVPRSRSKINRHR